LLLGGLLTAGRIFAVVIQRRMIHIRHDRYLQSAVKKTDGLKLTEKLNLHYNHIPAFCPEKIKSGRVRSVERIKFTGFSPCFFSLLRLQ
jgi:hypothetical protein